MDQANDLQGGYEEQAQRGRLRRGMEDVTAD
jgi:hypothetical protein